MESYESNGMKKLGDKNVFARIDYISSNRISNIQIVFWTYLQIVAFQVSRMHLKWKSSASMNGILVDFCMKLKKVLHTCILYVNVFVSVDVWTRDLKLILPDLRSHDGQIKQQTVLSSCPWMVGRWVPVVSVLWGWSCVKCLVWWLSWCAETLANLTNTRWHAARVPC